MSWEDDVNKVWQQVADELGAKITPIRKVDPYHQEGSIQLETEHGPIEMSCWLWYDSGDYGGRDGKTTVTAPNPGIISPYITVYPRGSSARIVVADPFRIVYEEEAVQQEGFFDFQWLVPLHDPMRMKGLFQLFQDIAEDPARFDRICHNSGQPPPGPDSNQQPCPTCDQTVGVVAGKILTHEKTGHRRRYDPAHLLRDRDR